MHEGRHLGVPAWHLSHQKAFRLVTSESETPGPLLVLHHVLHLTFVSLSSPSSVWLSLYLFPPRILTLFYSLSVSSSLFLSLSFDHTC